MFVNWRSVTKLALMRVCGRMKWLFRLTGKSMGECCMFPSRHSQQALDTSSHNCSGRHDDHARQSGRDAIPRSRATRATTLLITQS